MSDQIVDGHSRQVWWNADGETVIESYTIMDMAHGAPLTHSEGGVAGPYMIEAGISSSAPTPRVFWFSGYPRWKTAGTPPIFPPAPPLRAFLETTPPPPPPPPPGWGDGK